MKKPFNTLLEKDLVKHTVTILVEVLNKDESVLTLLTFPQSYSVDEIYMQVKHIYPENKLTIEFKLN